MATKTKCACCATMFLGTPIGCKACNQPSCATCRNNGSQAGKCCKCSNEECARTAGSTNQSTTSTSNSNNNSSASEFSEPDPTLQADGFMHPETKYGRRYKGVGPRGPSLAEFEKDSRWNWQPYQKFVRHVIKHLEDRKQLSAEDFLECASWKTDYGLDSPGWTGLTYDPELRLSAGPHPNFYEPEPIEAFQPVSFGAPVTLDPPDFLTEISSAISNDPGNYFCYDYLWAPNSTEDPTKYPFSFATVGSQGIHFFNQQHVMSKEYRPADRIAALAADIDSESFIYLHQEAKKVTVGSLSAPDDIVLEFDLPTEYNPQAVGVMKTSNGNQALIHGYLENKHYVMLYDLNAGSQTAMVPIMRYDYENKVPTVSRGALQQNVVMDPARPNVCYLGLLSDTGIAVVDTRMSRAARWIKVQDEITNMVIQPYGNCDKIVYSTGNSLVMYDLTAGKARFRHTTLGTAQNDIGAFGLASHGEQLAVGRFNRGGPDPIVSWLSWDNFESGSYFDTKKDANVPGSGGNFIAVNSTGVFVMEHNHAMHAPWQSPIGGKPMVKQVAAPSATASGVAPAQKGVRRAKRETAANSFSDPVKAPVPTKPTGFTLKYDEYEGLPAVAEHDHHNFSKHMWVAEGSDDPSKYPFSILCCGNDGISVFDHKYNFSGNMCNDYDAYYGINCLYPHVETKTLLAGSRRGTVAMFNFDSLFKPAKSTIRNIGFDPEAVTVMNRSAPQVIVGGEELLIYDMATGRRVSDVVLTHGGSKSRVCGLRCDKYRPDVLYAMGYEFAFLVDLRENSKASVRSFAPSKQDYLYSMNITEYGAADKLILTETDLLSVFDIGTGKTLYDKSIDCGAASVYGSTLCVATYESAVVYYDIENLEAGPMAVSEMPNRESAPQGTIGANWKGVYRKAADKLFFYPFIGTKL